MTVVSPRWTRRHDAVSDALKPPVRLALRLSVASMTMLPSSNFCRVPFKPVVLEDPLALPEADGLVENGCGFPAGPRQCDRRRRSQQGGFLAGRPFRCRFPARRFRNSLLGSLSLCRFGHRHCPLQSKEKRLVKNASATAQPYSDFGPG